jgi:hypothetical protein
LIACITSYRQLAHELQDLQGNETRQRENTYIFAASIIGKWLIMVIGKKTA